MSLQGMADGAQTARDAWGGLTGAVEAVGNAAAVAAPSIEAVVAGVEATGKAAAKAAKDAAAKAEADRIAAENLKTLRAEYEQLIASGNLDAAGRKLQEIAKAQRATASSAQEAAQSTALLEQAYKDLGMTTNEDLQRMATQARAAFDQLEKDGKQPPMRIAEAWKAMADKVIAANGGIAPEWLKTQAAVKGFEVAVDEAGKAVLNTDRATARAVSSMVGGMGRVRDAADGVQESMRGIEQASGRAAHAAREWGQGGPRNFVEERNVGVQGSQGIMNQNTGPLNLVPQFQTRQELDAWWTQWQNQYAQDNPFSVKSSGALGNYQYDLTQFAVNQAGRSIDLQQAAANARPKQEAERKPSAPSSVPRVPAPAAAPAAPQSVITHRHEVVIGGRQYNVGTDAAGSGEMQQLMAALERDANLSGGVH